VDGAQNCTSLVTLYPWPKEVETSVWDHSTEWWVAWCLCMLVYELQCQWCELRIACVSAVVM